MGDIRWIEGMDRRMQFVFRAEQGTESMKQLCAEFGIDRSTGWRWRQRWKQRHCVEDLGDRSRRPNDSPRKTPDETEQAVVELRRKYGWGAGKLQVPLAKRGIDLPKSTIHRVVKRNGLVPEDNSHRPAVKRFAREKPNQMWQLDFKGVKNQYAPVDGKVYPFSTLDDCSRFGLGLTPLPSAGGEGVGRAMRETFEKYGLPDQLLMDHGTPWWSTTSGHGLTWLAVSWMKQGIDLCHSAVRHPQTQGKVESFHRTLERMIQHRGAPRHFSGWEPFCIEFLTEYNYQRPHEALDMKSPASCYDPSPRRYQAEPPRWEYEVGAEVKKLNSAGCLDVRRGRFFVCEALANEEVCLESLGELLLVRFRRYYVRAINVETGRTRPLAVSKRRYREMYRELSEVPDEPGSGARSHPRKQI
jgi:transposase InsO family protein